jgi:spore germination protein KB
MERSKGKIATREFIAIVTLTIGAKMTDDTPAILYEKFSNAAWIAIISIGIFSVVPIWLLIKVFNRYKDKNLIEIVLYLLGKPFGYFVLFCLLVIGSVAITIDSSIYTDIVGTMYFSETPTIVLYAILMATCAFGAKRGLEQIGSFAWSILFWIKLSLFLALLLTFFQGKLDFIFPLFGRGVDEIMHGGISNLSIFADFLFLTLIVPFAVNHAEFKKAIWISLCIVTVELAIALIAFVALFDYEPVKMLNYPFHEAIRYIQLEFLPNIEALFFPFWLLALFIRFSFYLYLIALLFGGLFKIKEFEYLIPSLATLFVLLGIIPENPTFSIFHFRDPFLKMVTPVFILLPCLLWVMSKIKGNIKV